MPSYRRSQSEQVEEESQRKGSSRQEQGKVADTSSGEMSPPSAVTTDPVALLTSPEADHPTNAPLRAQAVAALQRLTGNAYVQRLLHSGTLQAKLAVSSPDDEYEREADRVAEEVTRRIASGAQRQEEGETLQRRPLRGQTTSSLERQADEGEEEEEELQPKRTLDSDVELTPDLESRIEAARGGGQGMDGATRTQLESALDADFSDVRVHSGAEADRLNRDLKARAFTTGRDIFFQQGAYEPGSLGGRELLAHELTHVVQQTGRGLVRGGLPDDETEVPRSLAAPAATIQRVNGGIEEQLPEGVAPTSASISFTIPGGMQVRGGWHDISTTDQTIVTLTLSRTGISLNFSPALRIDVTYPVSDIAWSSVSYDFTSASVSSVSLRSTQWYGIAAGQETVRSQVSEFVNRALSGTPIASGGYDPLTDPDPMGTLSAVRDNMNRLTSSASPVRVPGAGTEHRLAPPAELVRALLPMGSRPQPTLSDILNVEASVAISVTREIRAGTSEGEIVIPSGGGATLNVMFGGSAQDLMEASTRSIRWIEVSGESIILRSGGSDVANLQRLRVNPGGNVELLRVQPLGGVAAAGGAEASIRFLAELLTPGGRSRLAAGEPRVQPTFIGGITVSQIEQALTTAVIRLVQQHCLAIPGANLCEMLQIPTP